MFANRIDRLWQLMGSFSSECGPSFIPKELFANALIDLFLPTDGKVNPKEVNTQLIPLIDGSSLPENIKILLKSLARQSNSNLDQMRVLLGSWFDQSMDRVSGWYKRRVQLIILALSLLIATALNVDSVAMFSVIDYRVFVLGNSRKTGISYLYEN